MCSLSLCARSSMSLLIQQIISQFGDRPSDSMQYVCTQRMMFLTYKSIHVQMARPAVDFATAISWQSCILMYIPLRLSEENHLKSHSLTVEDAGRVVHLAHNLHPCLQSGRAYQSEVPKASFGHYHKFAEAVSRVAYHWHSHAYAPLQGRRSVDFVTLSTSITSYNWAYIRCTLSLILECKNQKRDGASPPS